MSGEIKVLLVEDHTMTRMGLQIVLEKAEGVELIAEAENGLQGVNKAIQHNPDVILMDIGLPEIDGVEATKRIRDAKLPSKIIMFTSRDSENDVFAALGAGADGYIMKGITPEQLISAIKAVYEGTGWLDPAIARMVLNSINQKPHSTNNFGDTPATPSKFVQNCGITDRELQVLKLIVEGLTNPQIAERLVISRATAKAHVHSILQKLCVDDRTQAAVTAMREGLV
ncbi:MAG: response regulator transcription factor [Candidatus Gastranaerophilaceae bacterium]|jgi:DNA-binding NarL/FixJ family response regulator